MRIFVTGNAGSGKTTVAQALARHTGLPYVGLDRIVWRAGWTKAPRDERADAEQRIASGDHWVVDGVSDTFLEAADIVIFLDVPRWQCYWRALWRNLPYLLRSRPGLPAQCPELLIMPTLIRIIWRFPTTQRPAILARQARYQDRYVLARDSRTALQETKAVLARTTA